MESKKKNITNNEIDAPSGRQSACIVSSVANLSVKTFHLPKKDDKIFNSMKFLLGSGPTGSPVNKLFKHSS